MTTDAEGLGAADLEQCDDLVAFDDLVEPPAPLPESATDAPPGSLEKQLVMAERAARRQQLFHPDDMGTGLSIG